MACLQQPLGLVFLVLGTGLPLRAFAIAASAAEDAADPQAASLWGSAWREDGQKRPHRAASWLGTRQRAVSHHREGAQQQLHQHLRERRTAHEHWQPAPAAAKTAPTVMPALSMAAITPPTQFPPPPPRMYPWADAQPLDTAIGDFMVTGAGGDAMFTPPPSAPAMNIALGCPMLLDWPGEVIVRLPDSCGNPGNWLAPGTPPTVLMNWSSSCNIFSPDLAPPINYHTYHEDFFGTSQTKTTLIGTEVRLFDCEGNVRYTIEEKVYKRDGKPDPEACEKYESCDGVISLQYFIKDNMDKVIGQTVYLDLFQNVVTVVAGTGATIATAVRSSGWTPVSEEDCDIPREWTITYGEGAQTAFPSPSEQWPIAEMLTIMSVRDGYRRPNGLMKPSLCEVLRGTLSFFIILCALAFAVAFGLFLHNILMNSMRAQLVIFELNWCPKRMKRASKFESSV